MEVTATFWRPKNSDSSALWSCSRKNRSEWPRRYRTGRALLFHFSDGLPNPAHYSIESTCPTPHISRSQQKRRAHRNHLSLRRTTGQMWTAFFRIPTRRKQALPLLEFLPTTPHVGRGGANPQGQKKLVPPLPSRRTPQQPSKVPASRLLLPHIAERSRNATMAAQKTDGCHAATTSDPSARRHQPPPGIFLTRPHTHRSLPPSASTTRATRALLLQQ